MITNALPGLLLLPAAIGIGGPSVAKTARVVDERAQQNLQMGRAEVSIAEANAETARQRAELAKVQTELAKARAELELDRQRAAVTDVRVKPPTTSISADDSNPTPRRARAGKAK